MRLGENHGCQVARPGFLINMLRIIKGKQACLKKGGLGILSGTLVH